MRNKDVDKSVTIVVMKNYLDFFLEQRMNSADGEEMKKALEAIIDEEKKSIELFKIQSKHPINYR